jgi:hypothetical protein
MSIPKKYYPIILLILINIIIGVLVFKDFGESWDEESVHDYAQTSIGAYKNFFDVQKMEIYYGDDVLRYYGPVFPVIAELLISPFKSLTYKEITDAWHLLNFLCFQLGLFFLYDICLRYFSKPVAFVSTVLFCTQPLIWGHAFINPRDIPFMVFFLGAISCGLSFSDKARSSNKAEVSINTGGERGFIYWKEQLLDDLSVGLQKRRTMIYRILGFIGAIFLLIISHLADPIVTNIVNKLYSSQGEGILSKYFFQVAKNVQNIPIEKYINKAITIVNSFEIFILVILSLLLLLVCFNFFQISFDNFRVIYFNNRWQNFRQSITCYLLKISQGLKKIKSNPRVEIIRASGKLIKNLWFLKTWQFWSAVLLLGLCISTRIAGPLAGLLISLVILYKSGKKSAIIISAYIFFTFLVIYLTWPFLWAAPIERIFESISVMSNFLWDERVLFNGEYYKGYALPLSYFPSLLCIQLTESGIVLSFAGLIISGYKLFKRSVSRVELLMILGWFFIPFGGILLFRSPMYDNTRHFLFIFPALFILAGFTIQLIYEKINHRVFALITFVIVLPGLFNIISLHPYSYVYYNSFVGGLSGANNRFELDYYGTSLKETTKYLNTTAKKDARVLVTAPIHLVQPYARKDIKLTTSPAHDSIANYDYVVYLNRFKFASYLQEFPEIFQVTRNGAIFSGIRILDQK